MRKSLLKTPANRNRDKTPARAGFLQTRSRRGSELVGRRLARHEVVEGILADAEPQDLFVAEGPPRIVDLLELGVLRRYFGPDLIGRVEARLHDRLRERHQLGAGGRQLAQSFGILRVI